MTRERRAWTEFGREIEERKNARQTKRPRARKKPELSPPAAPSPSAPAPNARRQLLEYPSNSAMGPASLSKSVLVLHSRTMF